MSTVKSLEAARAAFAAAMERGCRTPAELAQAGIDAGIIFTPEQDVEVARAAREQGRAEAAAEIAELEDKIERRRMRLVAAEDDLGNIRGFLAPNGFPRRVPMEISETVAPAVEWLLKENDRLRRIEYRADALLAELEDSGLVPDRLPRELVTERVRSLLGEDPESAPADAPARCLTCGEGLDDENIADYCSDACTPTDGAVATADDAFQDPRGHDWVTCSRCRNIERAEYADERGWEHGLCPGCAAPALSALSADTTTEYAVMADGEILGGTQADRSQAEIDLAHDRSVWPGADLRLMQRTVQYGKWTEAAPAEPVPAACGHGPADKCEGCGKCTCHVCPICSVCACMCPCPKARPGSKTPAPSDSGPAAVLAEKLAALGDVEDVTVDDDTTITVQVRPSDLDSWQWWLGKFQVPVHTITSRGSVTTAKGTAPGGVTVCIAGHGVADLQAPAVPYIVQTGGEGR